MAQVFISYSKRDPHVAQLFASALEQAGLSCWFDVEIEPNSEWRKRIEFEIDAADCVVVLWSSNSVQSRFVASEAQRAELNGKLVQVIIQQVRPPIGFDQVQHHDLVNWHGRLSDERWQLLLASIKGVVRGKRSGATGSAGRESRAANAWRHVSQSLDPTDYQSFISNYPDDALARSAHERLKDLDAWSRVDKRSPEVIRAFILTGPFEGLVEAARASIGDAERYQAGVFVDKVAREAARRAEQKATAEEKQKQAAAAAKVDRERRQAAAARADVARARRAAFFAMLVAASPALFVVATSIAVQIEYLLSYASGVTDWGVNLHSDSSQRAALNAIERAVVAVSNLVTWNWVVVGVSFGEAFYGLSTCCLGAMCWWVIVLNDDLEAQEMGSRLMSGCAAIPVFSIVLYLFAAVVPAVITVALFIFVGWLLLVFLAGGSLVVKEDGSPYGSALALCVFLVGVAFINLQDGYTLLNVWSGSR